MENHKSAKPFEVSLLTYLWAKLKNRRPLHYREVAFTKIKADYQSELTSVNITSISGFLRDGIDQRLNALDHRLTD